MVRREKRILIDNNHARAELLRAQCGDQPDAAGAEDDDVGFVVPAYGLCRALLSLRGTHPQNRGADAGRSTFGDELAPAGRLHIFGFSICGFGAASLCHLSRPPGVTVIRRHALRFCKATTARRVIPAA
jgi:hypothetical protein